MYHEKEKGVVLFGPLFAIVLNKQNETRSECYL